MQSTDKTESKLVVEKETEKDITEGVFEVKKTNFFGCSRWDNVYLVKHGPLCNFFSDRENTKLFLVIKTEQIISVTKRALCVDDRNTFSIFYYEDTNKKSIKELKLKCLRRVEVDEFMRVFKKKIFERFKFDNKESRTSIDTYILNGLIPKYKYKPFVFYSKLENLELIVKFFKMKLFFDKLKNTV